MAPREKWTDERLDDLNKKVDKGFEEMREGFARVDADIKELRRETDKRFDKVDKRFDKVDARFDKLNDRFDRLGQILIGGAIAIIVALIGSSAF